MEMIDHEPAAPEIIITWRKDECNPNRGMIMYQLICATTPFRRKDDFEPVMITKIETLMKRFIHKHPHNPTESCDEET